MSNPSERGLLAFAAALEPFLNPDIRKDVQALKDISAFFPGQSLSDLKKSIQAALASSRKSLPALVDRARAQINGSPTETPSSFFGDLKSLAVADVKKFGQALEMELAGTKADMIQDIKKWVESAGRIKPLGVKDRAKLEAQQFAGDLPEKMRSVDGRVAEEVIRRADLAVKELNKEGFEAFGKLLGISVSGSKPSMLKQIKNFVNRLAVTHVQTQF